MRRLAPSLALCFVSLAGCDALNTIDPAQAEGLVESLLKKEGVTAESVTCPSGQKLEKGNKFECTADVAGIEVHFALEVLDDQGTVFATPRDHTLVVEKVEPEIAADLKAKGHDVKEVDCHGDVWVAVKDAVVKCDVTDEAGTKYVWTATFTDNDGGHSHKIEPA